jgi:DNA-binding PadR family transcriptional regulator
MPPTPAKDRRYSELECFVLGLIWQLGPASPYDIRRHMQESPSTQWSASAGAIYPLIARLHKDGLLRARDTATGKRRRRDYSITAAGLRTLRAWIGPPLAPEAVTVAYDPLRSRARFLAALTPAQRRRWCAAALASLRQVEERVRDWQKSFGGAQWGGEVAAVITRSGEIDVQSRTEWLRELERALAREPERRARAPGSKRRM